MRKQSKNTNEEVIKPFDPNVTTAKHGTKSSLNRMLKRAMAKKPRVKNKKL
jgi:hypothetical protein